jgi:3',5'-cyclic AMP phosphodiesterase CpdA
MSIALLTTMLRSKQMQRRTFLRANMIVTMAFFAAMSVAASAKTDKVDTVRLDEHIVIVKVTTISAEHHRTMMKAYVADGWSMTDERVFHGQIIATYLRRIK